MATKHDAVYALAWKRFAEEVAAMATDAELTKQQLERRMDRLIVEAVTTLDSQP